MRELEVLGSGHLKLDFAECKEFFEQDLAELVRSQLKLLLEQALLAEQDRYLQLGYYEHAPVSRLDYRNGCYFRDLVTQLGVLCRLRVPRTRQGFPSQILPRYQRRQQAVNNLIRQAFLRGISTRQVGQVLEPVLGESYSAQTISNITRQLYPRIPLQLCWAHKMRNLAGKVRRQEGSCVAQASAIYRASSKKQAQRAFQEWKRHWEQHRPRAVACVERDLDNLLSFFAVPETHWRKVRTTNVIERAFREVRRRTRPMSSFSNTESCDRIIYGVISHLNSSWERKPFFEFTQTT